MIHKDLERERKKVEQQGKDIIVLTKVFSRALLGLGMLTTGLTAYAATSNSKPDTFIIDPFALIFGVTSGLLFLSSWLAPKAAQEYADNILEDFDDGNPPSLNR